jgi:hypothetical protein
MTLWAVATDPAVLLLVTGSLIALAGNRTRAAPTPASLDRRAHVLLAVATVCLAIAVLALFYFLIALSSLEPNHPRPSGSLKDFLAQRRAIWATRSAVAMTTAIGLGVRALWFLRRRRHLNQQITDDPWRHPTS